MDENWNLLNTNDIGELVFKSPTNTVGYLKNSEETAKTIQNGWLRTGDLGLSHLYATIHFEWFLLFLLNFLDTQQY